MTSIISDHAYNALKEQERRQHESIDRLADALQGDGEYYVPLSETAKARGGQVIQFPIRAAAPQPAPKLEFEAFPKIPRWNREIIVTEKIDGTNGAIIIEEDPTPRSSSEAADGWLDWVETDDGYAYFIGAQSRKRTITPESDNFGFARWVQDNAEALVKHLGPGRHYGEWWGKGIQRGYGLDHKRFSLFNTTRWTNEDIEQWADVPQLGVVPLLGIFPAPRDADIEFCLNKLRVDGSHAAPRVEIPGSAPYTYQWLIEEGSGYARPEGIVIFHQASRSTFKVLLEGDDVPKGEAIAA